MSDTTTPAVLPIPGAAADGWFQCGCSESGCTRAGYQAEALPLIVAAELRRLADELDVVKAEMREVDDRTIRSSGLGEGIARLRARADELDGGAR